MAADDINGIGISVVLMLNGLFGDVSLCWLFNITPSSIRYALHLKLYSYPLMMAMATSE